MTLTGRQYEIFAGEHAVTVTEVGAGLRQYTYGGTDVTRGYDPDTLPPWGCGAVLVPWPNRVRDGRYRFDGTDYQLALSDPDTHTAIHGLGRWARWTAVRHDRSEVTLALDVVPQKGWPFEVRVEVTYALDPATGLAVTATAHNHGRARLPFGAGFHPYLAVRGGSLSDAEIRVPAARRLILDEQQVPVGEEDVAGTDYDLRAPRVLGDTRLDAGFTALDTEAGRALAEVRTRAGGAQIWMGAAFGYVQVFTRDDLGGAGPAVAIEPMTCAPDAFNSGAGLVVLEPDERWHGTWGIVPLA